MKQEHNNKGGLGPEMEKEIIKSVERKVWEMDNYLKNHKNGNNHNFVANFMINMSGRMMARVYLFAENPEQVTDAYNTIVNMHSKSPEPKGDLQ